MARSNTDIAVEVGAAIVKTACKIWLGDAQLLMQIGITLTDLLGAHIKDRLDQRRVERFFDAATDLVAKRFMELREVEFRNLQENEWNAALLAVKDTFDKAQFTSANVISSDLDPRIIERALGSTRTIVLHNALLSRDGEELYQIALRKSCSYLVEIVATLPRFQPEAFTELLRRSSSTLWTLEQLLERLPEHRRFGDFEADYRSQIITRLDKMELFGASISEEHSSYSLKGAFVSLGVRVPGDRERDTGDEEQPVENVLAGLQRVLLLGEAGSGKTTLLRWLAVRSALGDFTRPLDSWNDSVAFFLPLRTYAGSELPTPNDFILYGGGRTIADEMPAGWVQAQLRNGRALVLIDGVDELKDNAERDASQRWLGELLRLFPNARYLVTSRPAAIPPDWLSRYGFTSKAVQPMSMTRIRSLVRRWHATIGHDIIDEAGRARIEQDAASLLAAIDSDRHLKALAINPLLCALLCALNRDRRGHLPSDRLEIYRAALDMLLERRDKERGIVARRYLTATAQTILLQEFAFWLVRNRLSDAPTDQVEGQLAHTLRTLPKITNGPDSVLDDLLVQSGLLREPSPGRIDFIHRTFQEYLAGKAAVEGNEIGLLLANAPDVQWHEVIIMAAGQAQPWQRSELLRGLLDDKLQRRINDELYLRRLDSLRHSLANELASFYEAELLDQVDSSRRPFFRSQLRIILHNLSQSLLDLDWQRYGFTGQLHQDSLEPIRYTLSAALELANHELDEFPQLESKLLSFIESKFLPPDNSMMKLLALACIQTVPQLDPDLQDTIEQAAKTLIPPKTLEVAESLGAAGRFVLDLLADCQPADSTERCAIIRAVAVIGHPDGLSLIEKWSKQDAAVADELVRAWAHFDLEQYAREILNGSILAKNGVRLAEVELVRALRYFDVCPSLDFTFNAGLADEEIHSFELTYEQDALTVLAALNEHPGLRHVTLRNCMPGLDLSTLANIPNLSEVTLGWSASWPPSLTPLSRIKQLRKLHLEGDMTLEELEGIRSSKELHIVVFDAVTSLSSLTELPSPPKAVRCLELKNCRNLHTLEGIERWHDLTEIRIFNCQDLIDFSALSALPQLDQIVMDDAAARVAQNIKLNVTIEVESKLHS